MIKRLLFFTLIMTSFTSEAQDYVPEIVIHQDSSLYHKPLQLTAYHLPANKKVKFKLHVIDAKNHNWYSEALYITDSNGQVDLSSAPSVGGSYLGIQPMGLFWSLKSKDYHQIATNKGFNVMLSIAYEDKVLVTKTFYRKSTRELGELNIKGVAKRDSIVANYYLPKSAKKLPAIIFIGGSGGNFREERASLYASEGFAVLDLKYFKGNGLPDGIIEIPLEYVRKAHKWLMERPEIDTTKIGIEGRSRGSELAMLYATKYSVRFVISQVPSSVVWFGWADRKSSWTYQNKPYDYAEYTDEDSERLELQMMKKSVQYRDGPKFLSAFKNTAMIHKALIPVEDIKCPILFISGKDDQVWPSTMMANMMVERLQEKNFGYEFMHLAYENAGHNFAGGGQGCGIPFLPPEDYSKGGAAKGGTDKGNALAAINSWNQILVFIRRQINN
ncbi:acyl-CoA thioester hydrolase/BAAT C-terminal domain-containing protein [Flavobacteriaceae bacterium M23B6Z8]